MSNDQHGGYVQLQHPDRRPVTPEDILHLQEKNKEGKFHMRLIQGGKNAIVKILSFDPKSNTVRYRDEDVRAIGTTSIDNFVISEDFSPTTPNQQQ